MSFLPSSVSVCPPSILSQGQPAPKPRQTALREVPLVLAEVAFERKKSRVHASPAWTPEEVKEQPGCVRAASAGGSARSGPRGRCTGRPRPCVCRHLAAAEEMAAARLGHRGSGPSHAQPSHPVWHRAPPRDPPTFSLLCPSSPIYFRRICIRGERTERGTVRLICMLSKPRAREIRFPETRKQVWRREAPS